MFITYFMWGCLEDNFIALFLFLMFLYPGNSKCLLSCVYFQTEVKVYLSTLQSSEGVNILIKKTEQTSGGYRRRQGLGKVSSMTKRISACFAKTKKMVKKSVKKVERRRIRESKKKRKWGR